MDTTRLQAILDELETIHTRDPRRVVVDGRDMAWEQHYAEQMLAWLARRAPKASPALQIAASAQHLRRWQIPRSEYPMDRAGYLRWRTELARLAGEEAAAIVQRHTGDASLAERVSALVRKRNLKRDPETQALEDTACLVFLEREFEQFAPTVDEDKLIDILRKTWAKMSSEGHALALALVPALPADLQAIVQRALAADDTAD